MNTWSANVSMELIMTPRSLGIDTRLISGNGGGCVTRLGFDVNTISLMLSQFNLTAENSVSIRK